MTSRCLQNKGHTPKPGFKLQIYPSNRTCMNPSANQSSLLTFLQAYIFVIFVWNASHICPVHPNVQMSSWNLPISSLIILQLELTGPSITYITSCPNPVLWPLSNWRESSIQRAKSPIHCPLSLVNYARH